MNLSGALSQLAQAHAQAVHLFSRYPLHQHIAGCPCCVAEQDRADLQQGKLARYAFKAMTTWGTETDFKHFLPVILAELTPATRFYPITVQGGACDLHCFASKLAYAHWQRWPAAEQQVIRQCLRAWWVACLQLLHQEYEAFLAGQSVAGFDESVEPAYSDLVRSALLPEAWLQQTWQQAWQPAAAASEAAYIRSPAFLLLVDWLYSLYYRQEAPLPPQNPLNSTIRAKLEAGFFCYSEKAPDLAQRLSHLLYYVEHSPTRREV
jgi:hypothetical protein